MHPWLIKVDRLRCNKCIQWQYIVNSLPTPPPPHTPPNPHPTHHQPPNPHPTHHQPPNPHPTHHQPPNPHPTHHQPPNPHTTHHQPPNPHPTHHQPPNPHPTHHPTPTPHTTNHPTPTPHTTNHPTPTPHTTNHPTPKPQPPILAPRGWGGGGEVSINVWMSHFVYNALGWSWNLTFGIHSKTLKSTSTMHVFVDDLTTLLQSRLSIDM